MIDRRRDVVGGFSYNRRRSGMARLNYFDDSMLHAAGRYYSSENDRHNQEPYINGEESVASFLNADTYIPPRTSAREELDAVIAQFESQHGPIAVRPPNPQRMERYNDLHEYGEVALRSDSSIAADAAFAGGSWGGILGPRAAEAASAASAPLASSSGADLDMFLEQIQLSRQHQRNQRRSKERQIHSEMAAELLASSTKNSIALDALMKPALPAQPRIESSRQRRGEELDRLLFSDDAPSSAVQHRPRGGDVPGGPEVEEEEEEEQGAEAAECDSSREDTEGILAALRRSLAVSDGQAVLPPAQGEVRSTDPEFGAPDPMPMPTSARANAALKSSGFRIGKVRSVAGIGSPAGSKGTTPGSPDLKGASSARRMGSVVARSNSLPSSEVEDSLREIDELKVWLEKFRSQRLALEMSGVEVVAKALAAPTASETEPIVPGRHVKKANEEASPVRKLANNSQASVVSDGSISFEPSFWQSLPRHDRYAAADHEAFLLAAEVHSTEGLPPKAGGLLARNVVLNIA